MKYSARITSEELEKMGFVAFEGNVQVITEVGEDFFKAIKYLKEQRVIGFDTETKPCFIQKMPRNKMAILQLSGADRAFIFRLQQIGLPDKLAKLLANPSVKKIGAAVHDDIRGLQAYRSFVPAGFVDLQRLSGEYGIEEKSVRKMSAIILGKKVSKSQQLSNWENSQLSEAQIRYAATDAWVCKVMYEKLMSEAENNG